MKEKTKLNSAENAFISIKSVNHLEKVTKCNVPKEDRSNLEKVIEKYPVRLSRHVIRQMAASKNIAYQYMPFVEELDSKGHKTTWAGQFIEGLIEQMYPNRVIFMLNMTCPVYCRFCFRKHKDSRNERNPTIKEINAAVKYVKNSPLIKEILITGGDPFLSKDNLFVAINGLMHIDHVQTLRLATRSISNYPELFLKDNSFLLSLIKEKNVELQKVGKRLEIATHFIHPDEISSQSLKIITDLVNNGIRVYIQTPFLNNCNDKGPELVSLFSSLRGAGAELHYIFMPCSPIQGNSKYWSPISMGLNIAKYLRAHLSDRAVPKICTATPIGKIDWYSSGWAVEKVEDSDDAIWIRTPYTYEFFKSFAPLDNKLDSIRVNKQGTLDIKYMSDIGEEEHFIGAIQKTKFKKNFPAKQNEIQDLKYILMNQQQFDYSIVNTGLKKLQRLHETRVKIDISSNNKEIKYIGSDKRITDVVISSDKEVIDSLNNVAEIITKLKNYDHINSIRLLSKKFNLTPHIFSEDAIKKISSLNKICVKNLIKLEIETWFIMPNEINDKHENLAKRLNDIGITVYCNVPLLGGVNDKPDIILNIANLLRRTGIEFHHIYVAGLPIQKQWNLEYPIDSYNIIDIASVVRREGSGREIPKYIILTPFGEVDYGLTSSLINEKNELKIKLECYDLSYYKSMDKDFVFSEAISIDNGRPIVNVSGLIKSDDFSI